MMKITACILQKLYHYEKKVLTVMILLQIGTCAMVKHYNTSTGRTILCESVKCQGALEFCKVNYSKDICKPCPRGSYMVDTIDSRLYENDRSIFKCVSSIHWSCPPEAEMVYGKTSDSNQPPCECDRSRGYYGPDYFNCYLVDKPCGLGLELSVKGNCVPCSPDTFKATNNFDLCISKTNCSEFDRYTISYGSTTSDAKCGPLMLSSTDKGHHNFISNDFEKSTIDVHSDSYQLQTNEGIFNMFSDRNIFLIIIIIPAVILVIVGPVAIGFCIKHRYSVHIKCCMEINRRKDRSSRIRREIPLQDKLHGSLDIVSYDAGADDINVESISGRRSSENSITRITVNVHTDSQQADDEMCVRISDISCQRNYGRDNENL